MSTSRRGVIATVIGLPEDVKKAMQDLAIAAGGTDRAEYIAAMVAWLQRTEAGREDTRKQVTETYIPTTRQRGHITDQYTPRSSRRRETA